MLHLLTLLVLAGPPVAPQTPVPAPSRLTSQIAREDARAHYQTGEQLMLEEAFEAAVGEFQTAVKLDPDFTLAHYALGQSLMVLDRYDEALAAFTAARDVITRQSHLDQQQRAEMEQARRDEIRGLEESLQRIRSGQMKMEGTMHLQVPIEDRLRFLREAEQRGVENEPRVPAELSLALGSAHFRLGQIAEAEYSYRSAIRTDGDLGAAHNNLAVVLMMTDRFEEARRQIREAERVGFRVSPAFKEDLESRAALASDREPATP
jgi:Flp pilus assembly protein TadD